jgi:hypothetical protein
MRAGEALPEVVAPSGCECWRVDGALQKIQIVDESVPKS